MRGGSCIFVMLYLCLKTALSFGSNVLSEMIFLLCCFLSEEKGGTKQVSRLWYCISLRKISQFTHQSKNSILFTFQDH